MCGLFNKDEVLNHAVEFVGDGVAHLSMDARMTIANMTTEWGALAGVFPFDEVTVNYLRRVSTRSAIQPGRERAAARVAPATPMPTSMRGGTIAANLSADADASYAIELELDLATVVPHVSGPNEVKTMVSLPEMERKHVPIQKAYLLSCVNARFEDLHDAAEVVRARGERVAEGVEFYLAAGERRSAGQVRVRSAIGKLWWTRARFRCRPVAERASALVAVWWAKARVAISATNRNFKGRMGDPRRAGLFRFARRRGSERAGWIYLRAANICRTRRRAPPSDARKANRSRMFRSRSSTGFPPSVRGRVLFIDKDNLNTDGIYAGKHTYRDDMTPEQMAEVTFENYDPNFNTLYQKGDVVVGGLNFGTGSSREQAATALKFKGIPCVIAASFSETYKRNAFNNGFVVFECPELVEHLRATLTNRTPTTVAPEITIDYGKSVLTIDGKSFSFPPLSPGGPGIDRGRRRRKSGRQAAPGCRIPPQ